MKENKNMKCDPCEQDFKHKVNELVKEGRAPSHADRLQKEHEVDAAFTAHKDHPQAHAPQPGAMHTNDSHAAMHSEKHPPEKHPEMAGMGKMKK